MVIRASAAREIGRLLTDLERDSSIQRETAIARLAIIGPRAVERLLILLRKTRTSEVRSALLRTLEAIGDKRALIPALASLKDGEYTITNISDGLNTGWHVGMEDHTEGDTDGRAFFVNADFNPGEFYRRTKELSTLYQFLQVVGRDSKNRLVIQYYGLNIQLNAH